MRFVCLLVKNSSVQAKLGRRNTIINPKIGLMMGKRSRKGGANSNTSLIGDSRSIPYYIPSLSILSSDNT